MPGHREPLKVIEAEYEKTAALLTSTVKEYNDFAAESSDLPVSEKVKADFIAGAEEEIAAIKSKLDELTEADGKVQNEMQQLWTEYNRVYRESN